MGAFQTFDEFWREVKRRNYCGQFNLELPELEHRPDCVNCRDKAIAAMEPASPPPWVEPKRGRRREIKPTWQFCPVESCSYYGWPGLGNLTSNGHLNGSPYRQWHCRMCNGYFVETRGTPLYRRTIAVEVVGRALTALAERLSLQVDFASPSPRLIYRRVPLPLVSR